ncbi:CHAT domain-containing tetratricopeptide repeat protein [Pseudarthrobacter sp. BRE9]|uniref:CHAT domain-containing tetratricopeptide repeat protein n=1 Tax=Pseudarthrobacter sp. BRE9 TaxID=2962582 RepID=UPI002881E6FF|nr:CHAT domain-containing tetratricopeptide repeat protein [Pseudarthrobacter sp. BRE9]MDT0168455.1 CHAT domain-containing tetratricopeptide repeat protein [Pseudarthrobacter sp. BRE9]
MTNNHPLDGDSAEQFSELGREALQRAYASGARESFDSAVNFLKSAVDALAPGSPDRYAGLSNLGAALLARFQYVGNLEDLDKGLDLARVVVESTPQRHPLRHIYLLTLGLGLKLRFERTDSSADLDETVTLLRQAVGCSPEDDAYYPRCLSNLGLALFMRSERTGSGNDLDESIEIHRKLLFGTAHDSPDRLNRLSNLASALKLRSSRSGSGRDIDEAIFVFRQLVDTTPESLPVRLRYLNDLAVALQERFERGGQLGDLDAAIEYFRRLVDVVSADHPDGPRYMNNLAGASRTRFLSTGEFTDLTEAINVWRELVDAIPDSHPARSVFLSNLGATLRVRFDRVGRREDLNESIIILRRAVDASPEGHFSRTSSLTNLGNALADWYGRTGQIEKLDEAIDIARQAVLDPQQGTPSWCRALAALASHLADRFDRTGQLKDLDEAIYLMRQVIEQIPEGDLALPKFLYLSNLGSFLHHRFQSSGRMEDLGESLEVGRLAVSACPPGHIHRSALLILFGEALRSQCEHSGQREDLEAAANVFRQATEDISAPPYQRLRAARQWGALAVVAQSWADAVRIYGTAIDLAGRVSSRELGRADQEFRLGLMRNLGTEAAAACLMAGQPDRAVEMFEYGRAVLFTQTLDRRSSLAELHEAHPDLAKHFLQLSNALEGDQGPSDQVLTADSDVTTNKDETVLRRDAVAELMRVVDEIRTKPDFEFFLKPSSSESLILAANEGPIVLLNINDVRSDALILTSGGVDVVPLSGVNPLAVGNQLTTFLDALTLSTHPLKSNRVTAETILAEVLAWLGDRITGPVLDHLGYTAVAGEGRSLPRVWWCPSGALALLPLHAAGHHSAANVTSDAVIDRAISSTIPTVGVLQAVRRRTTSSEQRRMLVVAMPRTPNQTDLPSVIHEVETLRTIYADKVTVLGLPGTGAATRDAVLAVLPDYSLVHFACHGENNLANPSASRLLLDDYRAQPLTVLDLMAAHLHAAELAFLSACTTARPSVDMPDEPIHLSAASQLAGYRHVIAALWPINDNDTAWLTARFYSSYSSQKNTEAAAALHAATQDLRALYRLRPSRWAPYTHTGP